MRFTRLTSMGAALGLTIALAAPVAALGHPDHIQKQRDDGPAAVEIGNNRGNPNGSNGTIKIDGVDALGLFDGHPNNEPHIGQCVFQVDFYGFDEGDTAKLSFKLWPPSGKKTPIAVMGWEADPANGPFLEDLATPLWSNGTTLRMIDIGGDGAGGGIDIDNQIYVQLTLDEGAHPKHGYHVKALAEITSGDRTYKKTKVFWVSGDCDAVDISS